MIGPRKPESYATFKFLRLRVTPPPPPPPPPPHTLPLFYLRVFTARVKIT